MTKVNQNGNYFHFSSYIPLIHIYFKRLVFIWFAKNFGNYENRKCIPNPMWIRVNIPHKLDGNTIRLGIPSVGLNIPTCCMKYYDVVGIDAQLRANNYEIPKNLLIAVITSIDKKLDGRIIWDLDFWTLTNGKTQFLLC